MGKTIRSFNASDEVNNLITESEIKKGELSNWINDKIKKGILYETTGTSKASQFKVKELVT